MDKHKNSDPGGTRDAARRLGEGVREPTNSGLAEQRMSAMDKREQENAVADREPLLNLKQAARALGLPYFKLQRAARMGLFPTYTLMNSRRLVRLSEVVEHIERSRSGGSEP